MAYQMAATIVTLNDLERYLSVAGLFKCNPSNICAAFYTISTDSVLARFLCISRAPCFTQCTGGSRVRVWSRLLPASSAAYQWLDHCPRNRDVNETRAFETGLETLTSHHKLIAEWTAKTKVKISK